MLERTRPLRPGRKRTSSWAGSLSLGRSGVEQLMLEFAKSVKRIALLALLCFAGCATENRLSTPWNQPTKSEISRGWWFGSWKEKNGEYHP